MGVRGYDRTAAIRAMTRHTIANCYMVKSPSKKVRDPLAIDPTEPTASFQLHFFNISQTNKAKKKADVMEHPEVFDHVGLLVNGLPGQPDCPSFSHPTSNSTIPQCQSTSSRLRYYLYHTERDGKNKPSLLSHRLRGICVTLEEHEAAGALRFHLQADAGLQVGCRHCLVETHAKNPWRA